MCIYVIGDIIATLSADTTQDNTTGTTQKEGHNSDPPSASASMSSSLPVKALSTEAFESTMAFMLGFVKKDM